MMSRSASGFALALVALAVPASATTPVMEPIRAYYGPIRACHPLFAIDVRAGEGLVWSTSLTLRFGRRYLDAGSRWTLSGDAYRDIVRPLGTLELPAVGRLERVQLASRNSSERSIVYLYDTRDRGPFPKLMIRSDAFDGSDRDVALLGRIVFGERAAAMCADMPEELRPRPEREDKDALWVSPARPAGPLTLCWAGLALDIRAGEAAIPFWSRDWQLFGVVTRGAKVTIQGSFAWLRDAAGRTFDRPFAASAEFEVRPLAPSIQLPPALRAEDGSAPRYVRLQRPVRLPHPEIAHVRGVTFAFSGPASDARIAELVGRLRPRTAADTCFEETSS